MVNPYQNVSVDTTYNLNGWQHQYGGMIPWLRRTRIFHFHIDIVVRIDRNMSVAVLAKCKTNFDYFLEPSVIC